MMNNKLNEDKKTCLVCGGTKGVTFVGVCTKCNEARTRRLAQLAARFNAGTLGVVVVNSAN